MKQLNRNQIGIGILLTLFVLGCGGYNVKKNMTGEARLELAKRMFKNEDYLEAKTQFRILTLNNPTASFIDEAQFFLAECHFHLDEYILAADEYGRLSRLYSQSSYVDDAEFKIALCYFELSPKPSLDQTYTFKAVTHFQQFLEDFPESDLAPRAQRMLTTCRTKLAQKEFKAGRLYTKLQDCTAALVYFDSVLDNYYDTKFADDALYYKGECLYDLKRASEAFEILQGLVAKFPKSEYKTKAVEMMQEIESEYPTVHKADGKVENTSVLGKQTRN